MWQGAGVAGVVGAGVASVAGGLAWQVWQGLVWQGLGSGLDGHQSELPPWQ